MPFEPFIGTIMPFAGNFAPRGWAFCAGQLLPIAQNQALFALVGIQFGGDGRTTFALPDLRGRCAASQGQGPGRANRVIGQAIGNEVITLLSSQIPPHVHSIVCAPVEGTTTNPSNALLAKSSSDVRRFGTGGTLMAMSPAALGPTGSSQPHFNLQPYLAINYIIALIGIFPSRP